MMPGQTNVAVAKISSVHKAVLWIVGAIVSQNDRLDTEIRRLRQDHNQLSSEIFAERSRREHARSIRLVVLLGILFALEQILFLTSLG
jgi:hypothetical protein